MKMRKSSSNRYLEGNNEKHGMKRYAISMSSKRFARYILSVCLSVCSPACRFRDEKKEGLFVRNTKQRQRGREGSQLWHNQIHTYLIYVYAHEMLVIDTPSRIWR